MRNPVMENLGIQERRIFISKMLCMTWLYSLRILNLVERGSGEVVDSVGFGRGRSRFFFFVFVLFLWRVRCMVVGGCD